jgi:hypothetical protein
VAGITLATGAAGVDHRGHGKGVRGDRRSLGDRDLLTRSHSRRDEQDLAEYAVKKNLTSIDGLPALAG